MNPAECVTQRTCSSELGSAPSIAWKIGDRRTEFLGQAGDAMTKLTLVDRAVYDLLKRPGDVTELRILGVHGNSPAWKGFATNTVTGLFDNHADLCKVLAAIDKVAYTGVYFTPQAINPCVIGRACNHLVAAKETTSDQNVLAYRFLLVDLDPVRPSGISSSESELAAALKLRDEIAEEISSDNELPEPIRAVSGNGGHLLYRLPDLAAAKYKPAVKYLLEEISKRYSTDKVLIDRKVFNPARIWKCYGTFARKGDPVPAGPHCDARPHRLAFIDYLPEQEVAP
jgi:hypothetical protein